jgi:hypothetical protein
MILAKSCKLLPVMLMSFLLHRRTFEWYKYVSVFMITLGVSCFMLWHPPAPGRSKREERQSSLYGLLLLSVNLMIDGATNSSQDNIFHRFRVNGPQMMFFMNFFSTLIMVRSWLLYVYLMFIFFIDICYFMCLRYRIYIKPRPFLYIVYCLVYSFFCSLFYSSFLFFPFSFLVFAPL